MNEFDNKLIYISVKRRKAFTGVDDAVSGIESKPRVDRLPDFGKRFWPRSAAGLSRDRLHAVECRIFAALKMQKTIMALMLVRSSSSPRSHRVHPLHAGRRKDAQVAVLKAIGAKDGMISEDLRHRGSPELAQSESSAACCLGCCSAGAVTRPYSHRCDVYLSTPLRVVVNPREVIAIVLAAFECRHWPHSTPPCARPGRIG